MHDDEIKHITHLLDLFMEGKTTLDEEAELSTYFATHNVPDEWADHKAMMAYFDAGMPLYGDNFHPAPQESSRQWPHGAIVGLRHTAWWAAAAIVVALVVNVALHTGNDSEIAAPQSAQGTASTPTKSSAASVAEASIAATTVHATHRTAPKATAHTIKAYHDSIAAEKIDGEMELCHMMAQADYNDWLNQVRQIQDATRATMLIEQGAALAMQNDNDDDDEPGELY